MTKARAEFRLVFGNFRIKENGYQMLLSKDLEGLYVSFVAKENVGLGLNIIFQQKQQWK